jgi:hypothetical protein
MRVVTQKNFITRGTHSSSPFFSCSYCLSWQKKSMFIAKPFAESLRFAAVDDRACLNKDTMKRSQVDRRARNPEASIHPKNFFFAARSLVTCPAYKRKGARSFPSFFSGTKHILRGNMRRFRNPAFIVTLALTSYATVAAPAAAAAAAATGAGIHSVVAETHGANPRQHDQQHAGGPQTLEALKNRASHHLAEFGRGIPRSTRSDARSWAWAWRTGSTRCAPS